MSNALGNLFSSIAAAIRAQTGETGTMKPAEFPEKILGIETGEAGENSLVFDTGEFTMTSTKEQTIPHNLGVPPDIVLYFMAGLNTGTSVSSSDEVITGELAYSAEAMAEGAERVFYMINTASFAIPEGINEKSSAAEYYGTVHKANPETFTIGSVDKNYFSTRAKYRWMAVGGLFEHNERYTVRYYDGDELVRTDMVPFGTVVTPPELTKEGHSLSWSPADMTVKDDTDFHAVWTATQLWRAIPLEGHLVDGGYTVTNTIESGVYYFQFIDGAAWTSTKPTAGLDETGAVYSVADILAGKTKVTFAAAFTYATRSSSKNGSVMCYVYWFDSTGAYINYTTGSKTVSSFPSTGTTFRPTFSASYDIPAGACYMAPFIAVTGYASATTFEGVEISFTMTVS